MGDGSRKTIENPIDDVGVGLIQQTLKGAYVAVAKFGQMARGEAADQEVGFPHAAMTALKQKLFDPTFPLGLIRHRVPPMQ
jgi:hypothetical protein